MAKRAAQLHNPQGSTSAPVASSAGRSAGRSGKLAAVVFALLAAGIIPAAPRTSLLAPAAQAQNLGDRTVSGTVMSAAEQPVAGATVFLKNQKTKSIRSFTSIANGHFQFAQVDKSQDFDLWAEKAGKKTPVKTVSSWDARDNFVTELKFK